MLSHLAVEQETEQQQLKDTHQAEQAKDTQKEPLELSTNLLKKQGQNKPLHIIMCLYPRIMKNKRYLMLKGNLQKTEIDDHRKEYVAIGCGHCIECRKQKAREWQIRLNEEIKEHKYNYFITFTFSPEAIETLTNNEPSLIDNVNILTSRAIRLFLERWRKKHGKSLKHWFITELGHNGTERIHIHGIIFSDTPIKTENLEKIWSYGIIYVGDYCSAKTINYIVKYVTKIDIDHKGYEADIFCSAGLGSNYYKNPFNKKKHEFKGKETIQYYTFANGQKCALPKYYRNHFWTEKQRGELWTYLLDSDKTFVRGIEIRNLSGKGYNTYLKTLEEQQKVNTNLGYGNCEKEWDEKIYKVGFDMINKRKNDYYCNTNDN